MNDHQLPDFANEYLRSFAQSWADET